MTHNAACQFGYTREQIEALMGDDLAAFDEWMGGQTVTLCDGLLYDHDAREYKQGCPTPHGLVVYRWDAERFLNTRPKSAEEQPR